jgi:hypothetical protein
MSVNQDNISYIVIKELIKAFQPLIKLQKFSPNDLRVLFIDMGYDFDPVKINTVNETLKSLPAIFSDLQKISNNPERLFDLVNGIRSMMDVIKNLNSVDMQLGQKLLEYLIVTYIEEYRGEICAILLLLGIIEKNRMPEHGTIPEFTLRKIHWDRILKLSNPNQLLRSVYGWGTPVLNSNLLLDVLRNTANLLDIPSFFKYASDKNSDKYLFIGFDLDSFKIGAKLVSIPAVPADNNSAGLFITPIGITNINKSIDLGNDWKFDLNIVISTEIGFGLIIRPNSMSYGSIDDTSGKIGNFEVGLTFNKKNPNEKKTLLLGGPSGSRLQTDNFEFNLKLSSAKHELLLEAISNGLQMILDTSQTDGFIKTIFGDKPLSFDFNGSLVWSSKTGLHFKDHGSLDMIYPINQTFTMIKIDTLSLTLQTSNNGIDLISGVTGSVNFGPIVITVDRIGIKLSLIPVEPTQHSGLLGNLDLSFGFKPPNGLGLSIDTSGVKGGGFIWRNQDQYAGVIDLDLQGFKVQALAVLDTKPDISLFFAIFAAFNPPYQLGAGWKITNIGGLIGFNRTVSLQQIGTGLKAGILDDILFPDKVVQNAPRLIDSFKRTFPAKLAQYLIGPAIRIGFGTPTILTGDVAVLLEFPSPTQLSILGKIECRIPDKSPIIQLNLGIIGAIDFTNGWAGIYGSLYNSKVLDFTLSGDMAMVISWGASVEKSFILSIGGFHPRFKPPSGFPPFGAPPLKRLQLALGNSLNFECYLALTSNTFQIGALVQARLSIGDVSISGSLGFDALFQFSPLYYAIDVAASFSVKYKGTTLAALLFSGSLEGPNPNRIKGKVTISILFLSLDVHVDITIGQKREEAIALTDPWPILNDALSKNESWVSQTPDWAKSSVAELGVVLNEDTVKDTHIIHPTGTLKVAQKVVPLNYTLSRFGTTLPANNFRFEISQVTAGDTVTSTPSLLSFTNIQDYFAQAQFSNFSDNEKLSLKSYDTLDAGASISFDHEDKDLAFFFPATIKEMKFETIIITKDNPNPDSNITESDKSYHFEDKAHTEAHMTASMSSKNILNKNKLLQYNYRHTMGNKISSLSDEQYIIVNSDDLTPVQSDGLRGTFSEAAAINKLNQLDTDDGKRLKVISIYEREVTV